MQFVSDTTNAVSFYPAHGEVHLIQHCQLCVSGQWFPPGNNNYYKS